jgi:hypothetical protein
MRFTFTGEQRALQGSIREFLEKECTPEHARAGFSRERWSQLAGLGVVGLIAPAEDGGLGLGEADLVLLLEEAGRFALPDPLVEASAAVALLRDAEENDLLLEVAEGDVVPVVGFERFRYVPHADAADILLLQRGEEMYSLPREAVKLTPAGSIDAPRPMFTVEWKPSDGLEVSNEIELVQAAFERATLGTAAELLGVASRCIEIAAGYAKDRHQFGRPIGSFQAVKHKLADALLRLEFARPVVYRAAASIAAGAHTRPRDVSMAKSFAGDAATGAARAALQTLGAIGYTQEHDLHIWLKRAWALSAAYGDAASHRTRVASAVLD